MKRENIYTHTEIQPTIQTAVHNTTYTSLQGELIVALLY